MARETGAEVVAPDDLALARRCVAGDRLAQRTFVGRFTRLVFGVCRRGGLRVDQAEDVTQEVFLDAFRHLAHYRGEARLTSWLFTLTRRRVATHYRREQREPRTAGVEADPAAVPTHDDLEARLATRQRAEQARRVIESLDDPTRAVLLAFYVAELSVREIVESLELPEGTVKSCLHRGRKAVRRQLGEP